MLLRRGFLLIVALMSLSLLIVTPGRSEAAKLESPILEYSYHIKIDLAGIDSIFNRIMKAAEPGSEHDKAMQKVYKHLAENGIFDLKDITFDFRMEDERLVGRTQLKVLDSMKERQSVRDFIYSKPGASVVRTMIPESETLAWLTVMDPAAAIPVFKAVFNEEMVEGITGSEAIHPLKNIREKFGYDLFEKAASMLGDEAHFILFDANMKPMDSYPEIQGAFVATIKESVDPAKLLPEFGAMIDQIFVEKYKATKTTSKWENFTVVSFKDFGCPAPINPSYILDKNFFIFATGPDALGTAAKYVLTPSRTAQGVMPPVMNGMMTINMKKIIDKLPVDMISMMAMTDGKDPHQGNLKKYIDEGNWGMIRITRSHTGDGIIMEGTANKELCSLACHVWRESMIKMFQEEMKYAPKPPEDEDEEGVEEDEAAEGPEEGE